MTLNPQAEDLLNSPWKESHHFARNDIPGFATHVMVTRKDRFPSKTQRRPLGRCRFELHALAHVRIGTVEV